MIITKKITLDPSFLNKDIKDNIYKIIEKEFTNKCFKEYGYILKINDIISYSDNIISNTNSKIIFTVVFDADTLNPKIGDKITGKIFYMDKNCILMNVENKAKVVIPINMMNEYTYQENDKYYIKHIVDKDNKTIVKKYNKNDEIEAIITNLRYINNNFDYIASLKE